jgi:hypothetical protein
MINPLNFPKINAYTNCMLYLNNSPCGGSLPSVINTILNSNIVENPTVTPNNTTIVVAPSTANRTLGTVTVLPQNPLYFTVNITGTGTESVTIKGASTAVSSDTATATVSVSGNAVIITGVAAGTSVISVFNTNKEVIATIYTTVAA